MEPGKQFERVSYQETRTLGTRVLDNGKPLGYVHKKGFSPNNLTWESRDIRGGTRGHTSRQEAVAHLRGERQRRLQQAQKDQE